MTLPESVKSRTDVIPKATESTAAAASTSTNEWRSPTFAVPDSVQSRTNVVPDATGLQPDMMKAACTFTPSSLQASLFAATQQDQLQTAAELKPHSPVDLVLSHDFDEESVYNFVDTAASTATTVNSHGKIVLPEEQEEETYFPEEPQEGLGTLLHGYKPWHASPPDK